MCRDALFWEDPLFDHNRSEYIFDYTRHYTLRQLAEIRDMGAPATLSILPSLTQRLDYGPEPAYWWVRRRRRNMKKPRSITWGLQVGRLEEIREEYSDSHSEFSVGYEDNLST